VGSSMERHAGQNVNNAAEFSTTPRPRERKSAASFHGTPGKQPIESSLLQRGVENVQ